VKGTLPANGTAMVHGSPLLFAEFQVARLGGIVGIQVLTTKSKFAGMVAIREKSEMPDFDKAWWEHMEEKAPDKYHCIQWHNPNTISVLGIAPPKADLIVRKANQSAIANGDPMRIVNQVLQHMLGIQRRFDMDHPFFLVKIIEKEPKPHRIR